MSTSLKFNSILILLIPLLLITGPFLSDLVVSILFFSSIYLYFKNELLIKNNLKKFLYFFFIFYIIGVLSSSLSIDKYISLKSSLPYLRYLGLILIGYYIYQNNEKLIEKLGLVVFLIFLFFFIDSLLFFYFGFDFPTGKMANERFSSFFGDEKVLGSYVVRLAPLGLIFILSIKNFSVKKYSFIGFIFLTLYLIFLSGERTALVMFFVQLLLLIVFFQKFRKILYSSIFSILIFLILTIYFLPQGKLLQPLERIFIHSLGQLYFNNQQLSLFSSRHEDHYNTSINIFKDKFLLGGGNKSFRFMCSLDDYSVRENVENRFTEYAQYSDYIHILEYENYIPEQDSFYLEELDILVPKPEDFAVNPKYHTFILYYQENKKLHSQTKFNISKFKDFLNKPLYINRYEVFDKKDISDKKYLTLNKAYVRKEQKLFLYDGAIYFGDGCNTHPHHIYLQIASENGILNLIIIVSLLVYILLQFMIFYREKFDDKEVLLLCMIFIQILPIIPSGNFYNNWLSIFFFLPIGFYFALKDKYK